MTDTTEFTATLAERTVVVRWPDNERRGATPPPDGWQDRAWAQESTLHEIDEGSISGCSVLRWRDDPRPDAELVAVSLALVTGQPVPASAVVPAADRAALRDRIAEAIADATGARWPAQAFLTEADAVLSVLPAPADRAAEWNAAADHLDALPLSGVEGGIRTALTDELRRQAAVESAVVDRVAAETPPAETHVELQVWPLQRILTEVRCGSEDWSWEEEWADLDRRHAETGYLARLEQEIRQNGITFPVLVGTDGRLWDGHHRLCIAVRLGIGYVPVEVVRPAVEAQPGKDTETPQPKEA